MARRGDVLRLKRRIGFASRGTQEMFVAIQDERFGRSLDTLVVVPLDEASAIYDGHPGVVPVSGAEAGADRDQVAIATHPCTVPADRFESGVSGRLGSETLARLDRLLGIVLGLR